MSMVHWITSYLLEAKALKIINNNPGISSGKLRHRLNMKKKAFYRFLSYLVANKKIFTKSIISKKTGKKYFKIYLLKGIVEEI